MRKDFGEMRERRGGPLIDSRPEEYPYRDDGCEISPSCLRCPLPQCKYDDPRWFLQERRRERDQLVLDTKERESLSVDEVAHKFALSQRTVFRILRRASDGKLEPASAGGTKGAGAASSLSRNLDFYSGLVNAGQEVCRITWGQDLG